MTHAPDNSFTPQQGAGSSIAASYMLRIFCERLRSREDFMIDPLGALLNERDNWCDELAVEPQAAWAVRMLPKRNGKAKGASRNGK